MNPGIVYKLTHLFKDAKIKQELATYHVLQILRTHSDLVNPILHISLRIAGDLKMTRTSNGRTVDAETTWLPPSTL